MSFPRIIFQFFPIIYRISQIFRHFATFLRENISLGRFIFSKLVGQTGGRGTRGVVILNYKTNIHIIMELFPKVGTHPGKGLNFNQTPLDSTHS